MTVAYRPMQRIDYLVVHCSATPPKMDIGRLEIALWHRQRGFLDIGYHYVIRRDGTIEKGRPDDMPGAHAPPYNSKSVGICLVGGVAADGKTPEANFTDQQMHSLRTLLELLKTSHPDAEVIGHRDVPGANKACPSFDMKQLWKEWTQS